MRIAAYALLALVASVGEVRSGTFDNSKEMAQACQEYLKLREPRDKVTSSSLYALASCGGFMRGYFDGFRGASIVAKRVDLGGCLSHTVTAQQLAAIFVQWVERNPSDWHKPPGVTMIYAVGEAFPCAKPKP